eukprot:TRINITY_DN1844_c0_g1_i2.p1 TRINITY_DN1844_c0_g1~~TRINITY_DN1844_c0_g1_i2.p1  ORF type:complete len:110 (+),score=14.13 TRINITY_DN1844_c0_g1_i2:371-700(+)
MAQQPNPTGFTVSLLGCCGDCNSCLMTCLCPCMQVAKNKAMVDNRECTICDYCCAAPNLEYFTRQQIRARFNLEFSTCADCLAMIYCGACVICQDSREIKLRNPSAAAK